ncbi:MAG TPA: phosphatidate cytidylyltransferase [Alphaproteobacteria bacterium]|nr:phosphatidate cytidylyltransferase [Alphaproteobacteria bacterium]
MPGIDLPWPVLLVLLGIAAVLLAATLLELSARGRLPEDVRPRLKSWWAMAAIYFAAALIGRTASIVLIGFTSFLALKEYLTLIPTRRADRAVLLVAYLAIPLQFYWVAIGWYGMFIVFVPVYMLLILPIPMLLIGETSGFLRAIGTLHWGLMTTVFALSHAAYLLVLPTLPGAPAGGAGLLLFLLVLTETNDVAQYVWGKMLGRTKIVPKISPKKTVEGLVGGVATTTALAIGLAPLLTPLDWPRALAAGLGIGIAGFIGDIVISAVKRDLAIKDTGALLPGHGGMLDRLDSLTYTAPLFFHTVWYVYY